MDPKILNLLFEASLEFGENFRRPVAEIVEECCPSLSPEEKTATARRIEETRHAIEEYFYTNYDYKNAEANSDLPGKGRLWIQSAYPWMSREAADRAVSQGMYFAWRG